MAGSSSRAATTPCWPRVAPTPASTSPSSPRLWPSLGCVADPGDLWGERTRLRPRQLLFDVAAAAVFTLVAVAPATQQPALVVVATLAMGLALAVRRVSWPAMVVLAAAAGVCQLVAGELAVVA